MSTDSSLSLGSTVYGGQLVGLLSERWSLHAAVGADRSALEGVT